VKIRDQLIVNNLLFLMTLLLLLIQKNIYKEC